MTALVDPGRTRWLECDGCGHMAPSVTAMAAHKTEQGCTWTGSVGEAEDFMAGFPNPRQETM